MNIIHANQTANPYAPLGPSQPAAPVAEAVVEESAPVRATRSQTAQTDLARYHSSILADIGAITGGAAPVSEAAAVADAEVAPTQQPPTLGQPNGAQLPSDDYYWQYPKDGMGTVRFQPDEASKAEATSRFSELPGLKRRGHDAQQAILTMLARMTQIEKREGADGKLEIAGVSPMDMFVSQFVNNPEITDDMFVKMANVEIGQLTRTPEEIQQINAEFPNHASTPAHRIAVALLSAITGIPPAVISHQCPDLGLSGTPDCALGLWEPGTGRLENSDNANNHALMTVLHDVTDNFEDAGVEGTNLAIWDHGLFGSAWESWDEARSGEIRSFEWEPSSGGGTGGGGGRGW